MLPIYLSKTKAHSAQRALMKEMLIKLQKHRYSSPFLEPVDWEALGLLDYPSFVSHPMDLSTVQKKLKSKEYQFIEEFFNDLHLIWWNCITYNTQSHWLGQQALKLKTETNRFTRNYFPKIKPDGQNNNSKFTSLKDIYLENKLQQNQSCTVPFKRNPVPPVLDEEATKKQFPKHDQSEDPSQESEQYIIKEILLEYLQMEQYSEHINKIYFMFQKKCPKAVNYDQHGTISVNLAKVDFITVQQAIMQLEQWQEEQKLRNF